MIRAATLLVLPSLLHAAPEPVGDHDHAHPAHSPVSPHHPHLEEREDGWFRFRPHLNAAIALGGSTSEKNFALIQGNHAPIDDGFNLQGLEFGALMDFGDKLSVQSHHNFLWDRFDGWESEWEEGYAVLDLPAEMALRGGQFFAPFGQENRYHIHDRLFVEPPISVIRLLGEHGLILQGGELIWNLPGGNDRWVARLGYGQSREHTHGRNRELRREAFQEALEHAGEDHEGEEEEEHGEEHHHGHGFAGDGGIYDPEQAYLGDGFFFGRLEHQPGISGIDRVGLSFAAGENGFGLTTWSTGADLYGESRLGGCPIWWQGEAFYRAVAARDDAGIEGDFDELGLYLASALEFIDDWTLGGRLEWASGNRMAGHERRWRASTNLGRVFQLTDQSDVHVRLQYSYDRLGGYADEHSIWLQFVLNLGTPGSCVTHQACQLGR